MSNLEIVPARPSVYESLPLEANRFRLLSLAPGIGYGALSGTLVIRDLSQSPAYEAISYHWASAVATERISLNGTAIDVASTAAAALRSCRHHSEHTLLWIDQICINQKNAAERSAQVTLMGNIYSQATNVNICFDRPRDGIAHLFAFARRLEALRYQANSARAWHWGRLHPAVESPPSQSLFLILGPDLRLPIHAWAELDCFDGSAEDLAMTLASLLENMWFRRAWVIQEAVLARRLYIVCGRRKLSWDTLLALVRLQIGTYKTNKKPYTVLAGLRTMFAIDLQRQYLIPRSWQMRWAEFWGELQGDLQYPAWVQILSNMRMSLSRLWSPSDEHTLVSIMRHFRHLETSDGRDKIFGFLGLARDWKTDGIPFAPPTGDEVDGGTVYTASISEVCFGFAFHHILITGTLDVLMGACCGAKAHEDLTFWVADWSQEPPSCDTEYGCPLKSWPHSAGGDTIAVPECIASQKALVLRGILFDVVDEVINEQDVFDISTYNDPTHEVWAKWTAFATTASQSSNPYGGDDGRFDAFWRTLTYDTNARGRRATLADGRRFRRWLRGDLNALESNSVTGRILWKARKLYKTKKGHLGNGCAEVKPGDCVFVLRGGRLPLILRAEHLVRGQLSATSANGYQAVFKSLQGYRIIGGDSYVHGICDGEVWNDKSEVPLEREIALI